MRTITPAPRWACVLVVLLNGCVTQPAALRQGPFEEITVAEARQRDLTGRRVRWGGTIAAVRMEEEGSCFEVVSRPLDRHAQPLLSDETSGRFLACAAGFHDPVIYADGRELTVIGTLQPSVKRKIGEFEYLYPKVRAEHVHLWPIRTRYQSHCDPWLGPCWYPYPHWYPYPYRPPYSGPWHYPPWRTSW